jgi:hypothetical protein
VLFNDDSEITLWIQKLAAKFYTGANVKGHGIIKPMKEQVPWPHEMFWSITTGGYYEGPTNKTLSLTAPAPPSVMGHLIRLLGQGKKNANAAKLRATNNKTDDAYDIFKNDETVWPKVNEETKEGDTGESASNPDEEPSDDKKKAAWAALPAKDSATYQNLAYEYHMAAKAKAAEKTGRDEHGKKVKVLTNRDLASFSWLTRLDHADDLGSTVPRSDPSKPDPSKMTRVWRVFYQHR